jgi:hypothetical protein
MVVKT